MQTSPKNRSRFFGYLANAIMLVAVLWDHEPERWPRTIGVLLLVAFSVWWTFFRVEGRDGAKVSFLLRLRRAAIEAAFLAFTIGLLQLAEVPTGMPFVERLVFYAAINWPVVGSLLLVISYALDWSKNLVDPAKLFERGVIALMCVMWAVLAICAVWYHQADRWPQTLAILIMCAAGAWHVMLRDRWAYGVQWQLMQRARRAIVSAALVALVLSLLQFQEVGPNDPFLEQLVSHFASYWFVLTPFVAVTSFASDCFAELRKRDD